MVDEPTSVADDDEKGKGHSRTSSPTSSQDDATSTADSDDTDSVWGKVSNGYWGS
jgi:hypothetical protein